MKTDLWNLPRILWNKTKDYLSNNKSDSFCKAETVPVTHSASADNGGSQKPDTVIATVFDEHQYLYDLQTLVLHTLKRTIANKHALSSRKVVIGIQNATLKDKALLSSWADRITDYIDDKWGPVHSVEIQEGPLPANWMPVFLCEGIQLAVGSPATLVHQAPRTRKVAVLKMLYDRSACKLHGDIVEMQPEEGRIWHIGWGTDTEVDNRPRYNEVALEYKEPDMHDADVYMISRAHAYIKYLQGFWFLFVERGLRVNDERTKIERDNRVIELSDCRAGKPLRNRDVIRLNNEYLLFTIEERQENK